MRFTELYDATTQPWLKDKMRKLQYERFMSDDLVLVEFSINKWNGSKESSENWHLGLELLSLSMLVNGPKRTRDGTKATAVPKKAY